MSLCLFLSKQIYYVFTFLKQLHHGTEPVSLFDFHNARRDHFKKTSTHFYKPRFWFSGVKHMVRDFNTKRTTFSRNYE